MNINCFFCFFHNTSMFQQHFRISHFKDNLYRLTNNVNEIIYDQLKNGYEVNSIINYLNSNRNLES